MNGPEFLEVFEQEAAELLELLEQGLLDLQTRPEDGELVNAVFRAMHTLKGSGAMFGFGNLAAFIHDFESAFDNLRAGAAPVSDALISVALEARDHAAALIAATDEVDADSAARGEAILQRLQAALPARRGEDAVAPDAPRPASATDARRLLHFQLGEDALRNGCDPLLLLDELRGLGAEDIVADLSDLPSLPDLDPELCVIGWEASLPAEVDEAALSEVFMFVEDGMRMRLAPLDPAAEDAPETAAPPERSGARAEDRQVPDRSGGVVRVPAERLDSLMDMMGELVIAQARLNGIAERSLDPSLRAAAEEMDRLAAGLRDATMGMRMVPIGSLFGRFRRLVHDLSEDLGKPIRFETRGEETELDKTMIERLADPLVHLIRNAADHGLESAALRRMEGKPETGTIRLSAEHVGAEVAIRIEDDGAGLDAGRIRAKAEAAGLLEPGADISVGALHRMIFEPGFSTAQEVTKLSGRGVGMDVVRRTVEGLRGAIDVDSTPGAGAAVTLRLPLTLAIIDGLLVRVGAERYVIPLAAVEECVALPNAARDPGDGADFLNIRGALAPFLRLREMFGVTGGSEPWQKVVVIRSGERRVGLVVDQILGADQIVIKQLSQLHSGLRLFSGATILGDGGVALILDMMHLVDIGRERAAAAANVARDADARPLGAGEAA